ncbi:MAG: carboxypeptidase-like regulatory domain-containing protein [Planctomycetes bacterium]|jgi:protocatechuate 3,4-dioxygenase beta subunit|nr:carboxypeptidase-like regulatory domain-containing protein [Planctomycetota bacterium]
MSRERCPQCGEDGKFHAEVESALSRDALDPSDRERLAAEARHREGGPMARGRGSLVIVALAAAALLIVAARYVLDGDQVAPAPPRETETARAPAPRPDLPPLPAAPAGAPTETGAGPAAPAPEPAARAAAPAPAGPPADESAGAPAPIGELSGVVVGTDGLPVAGAKVEAWCQDPDPEIKPRHFRAESDPNGEFRFDGVPAGKWFIDASAAGRTPRRYLDLRLSPDSGLGGLRLVLAGEDPSKTGAIEGTVTGRDGQPVAGARIAIEGRSGGGSATTTTDGAGCYRLAPVVPGDHVIRFSDGVERSRFISVAPGQTVRVDFGGGGTLRGILLDASGTPLAQAIVRIAPLDEAGKYLGGKYQPSSTRTGVDGRFEIPAVTAGPWQAQVQVLTKGDSFSANLGTLDLTGGDQEVTLRLRESGIAGRLLDADNGEKPSGRPQISLYVIEPWSFAATAFLNEDGSFRFRSVAPGRYRIFVHLEGYRKAQLDVELADGELKTGVDIALSKLVPATVIFRVTDASGAPVEGVEFVERGEDGISFNMLVKVTAPGTYVYTQFEPGMHTIWVRRTGLSVVSREITVAANTTTTVEIVLTAAEPK